MDIMEERKLWDIDPDPEAGAGAGGAGDAYHGASLDPNSNGSETSGAGGGGAGTSVPFGAGGGFGGQAPPMTGLEGLHTQPGAPLPPGATLPTQNPVIDSTGARRRESGHGQPVSPPWFDPNQQQQQYYPQQPFGNVDSSVYSSGLSGSAQYGVGGAVGPYDPFAPPAAQQGQYPRDSKASYFDPQASGTDQPTSNVAATSSTSSRPTSDEKPKLIAMDNSRADSMSPPGHGRSDSVPATKRDSSSSSPQSAGPKASAIPTSNSPVVRPMSTAAGSSTAGAPFNNSNNPEAESDEPPPPSYAEAERSR
ncbi:hypothetical protein FRC00_001977 [Tulasnella sp. 408]|nr:hypothetical protein FRC00_001977 [Tulasnella sp. 408]